MVADALVDETWWRERQDDYLAHATTVFVPTSPLNVLDHLEWSQRLRNPFASVAHGGDVMGITGTGGSLTLDLAAGTRTWA